MKVIIPPIKSHGIKTKLVPWIMDVAPKVTGRWIEPFLGTGVVAFNSGYKQAILNDTNPHIIDFYKKVQAGMITASSMKQYLQDEGKLLSEAENAGLNHYLKVRSRFNSGELSPYDFIFLSRSGFNGLIRYNKKGNWNVPFCKKPNRFAKTYITKIVNQLSAVNEVIQPEPDWCFHNKSFAEIIPMATGDDILYCDPPYLGRHSRYYNDWEEKDEELLFHLLSETKAKFMLSTWYSDDRYDNEVIKKYWDKFNIVKRDHAYIIGGTDKTNRSVVEALVCNFETTGVASHNHELEETQLPSDLKKSTVQDSPIRKPASGGLDMFSYWYPLTYSNE